METITLTEHEICEKLIEYIEDMLNEKKNDFKVMNKNDRVILTEVWELMKKKIK